MSFFDSDSSEKIENNNKNYTKYVNSEKKKKKNDKLFKSLNISKNDETKKNIKTSENDISTNQEAKTITKIYKYITRTLENFIEKNYSNYKFVNNSLKTIYSHIKVYLESLKEIKKPNDKKNTTDDENQKILYEFKIDRLTQQIKELKQEISLLCTNETNKFEAGFPKKFKIYNYLKKKNLKLENKTKLDEFKYLLCIKEQQKKINELENKLKLKILENSKEAKESKLFPIITQFDLKEHVNSKSIPLTQTIIKNSKSSNRNICKLKANKKDHFLTITNSGSKTPFKMISDKSNKGKDGNSKNKKDVKELFKSINVDIKEEKPNEKNKDEPKTRNKVDFHFNILKLNSEIIPNKDKKFFISHPNLNIAGINTRLDKYTIGIPNKLFSFKFSKNIDKNAFYKFPSTLNEIFVELEKLRIHTNNTDIINNY